MRYQTNAEVFAARRRVLSELGFDSYAAYLASPLWKEIRRRAFEEHGADCCRCGERASDIHHRDYQRDTLAGESLIALTPVCGGCHRWASVDEHGQLRPIRQTNRMLRRQRAGNKKKRRPGEKKAKRAARAAERRNINSFARVDTRQRLRDLERLQTIRPVKGGARQIEALRAILAAERGARESMQAMDATVAAIVG